ncbi:hypothetical protein F183_A09970 [Bryobacterales bacterium F-183]|nr:hypothetical protein F183_A09970 [Bryobacterales bacterium F-183]
MSARLLRLVLVAFLTVAAPAVIAQPVSFDVATFDPPAGWERIPNAQPQDPLSYRSADQTSQVFLFPSRGGGGRPEENFQSAWARLVKGPFPNVSEPKVSTEQRSDGWTAVVGAAELPNTRQAMLLLTATSPSGRVFHVVGMVAGNPNLAALAAFLKRLRLASADGGAAASSSLTGLYTATQVNALAGDRVAANTRYFLPGNRIARVFPYGSGNTFDPSRCSGDTCGTYSIAGNRMTIRWDNGRTDEIAYEAVPEGIRLDGTLFRPARTVAPAVLPGMWQSAGGNVYRFTADGAFTFGTTASAGLGGRFRVEGLTLVLTYSDGDVRRRTLLPASPADPPGLISIEGEVFVRK